MLRYKNGIPIQIFIKKFDSNNFKSLISVSHRLLSKKKTGDDDGIGDDSIGKGLPQSTRLELLAKLKEMEKETYKMSKIDDDGGQHHRKLFEKLDQKSTDLKSISSKLDSLLGAMKVEKRLRSSPVDKPVDSTRYRRQSSQQQPINRLDDQNFKIDTDRVIDRRPPSRMVQRKEPLQTDDGTKKYERTDFFDRGPGLNIFTPVLDKLKSSSPSLLPVWENLERHHLKQLINREPRNGFEEMIRWTDEGKTYPYPIDNDYGHYEQNVNFDEHVFLEHLLDDGFPTSGPIRHFMELVVHGLSSNPYMTKETKHGHIAWFREYFAKRGPEIERLHALDIKHQQALAEIEAGAEAATTTSTVSTTN